MLSTFYGTPLSQWHSGGGCMALRGELPGGHHILITDAEGSALPGARDWAVGLYDPDGETLVVRYSDGSHAGEPGLAALTKRYDAFLAEHGLPSMSADELLLELQEAGPAKPEVITWLNEFVHEWNRWEDAEYALFQNAKRDSEPAPKARARPRV